MTRVVPTAEFASILYGADGVGVGDAAEDYHEASRLYPHVAPGRLSSLVALGHSVELQQTVARAARTHPHRPSIALPREPLPRTRLRDALARRRSLTAGERRALPLAALGTLLATAYAATEREPGTLRRPVPSGGALYPLELYLLALAVDDVGCGAFHYNPFRHDLELLRRVDRRDVAAAAVDPGVIERAAAVVVVTAMFWRSRFKYGARGYRFALLEAGHVGQNLTLAAAALRLRALPLGGFYDRRVDDLVGADGLDEATVYAVALGGNE